MASKEEDMAEEEEEGPPPGWQSFPPQPSLPPPPTPPPPSSELGQMVCGSCRRLLSYPKGSRHVQCQCCQMINFVLEAHEVGQVKCGSCDVLLMYPYGASSVRCSSCRFVTEIGEQNRRPPWSMIQGYPPRPMSFNPISWVIITLIDFFFWYHNWALFHFLGCLASKVSQETLLWLLSYIYQCAGIVDTHFPHRIIIFFRYTSKVL